MGNACEAPITENVNTSDAGARYTSISQYWKWCLVIAWCLAILWCYLVSRLERVNLDAALNVQLAQEVLDGKIPFVDFVDTNPPAIIYWNLPHVAAAGWLEIDPRITFYASIWLLLAGSTAVIFYLLVQVKPEVWPAEIGTILVAWILATFALAQRGDFGQREHIFMLSYIPLLILRLGRRQGVQTRWPLSLLIGIVAGAGACFKPHFVAIVVIVECVPLVSRRDWHSLFALESLGFVAVVVAYIGHWVFVPVAMREQFFGHLVPLMLLGYEAYVISDFYGPRVWQLLVGAACATGIAAIGAAKMKRAPLFRLLFGALLAGMVSSLVVYVAQNRGYPYHLIPFAVFTVLMAALGYGFILEHFRDSSTDVRTRVLVSMPLIAALVYSGWLLQQASTELVPKAGMMDLRRVILENTRRGDKVAILSTSVGPAYPLLLNVDRRPAMRYTHQFPIAFAYLDVRNDTVASEFDFQAHGRTSPVEREYLAGLESDLRTRHPRLVFVRDSEMCQGCPDHFNLYSYFQQVGILELLQEMGYKEIMLEDNWHGFIARDTPGVPEAGAPDWAVKVSDNDC